MAYVRYHTDDKRASNHNIEILLKKEPAMSYITTKDNTKLFYKDWGSGKPVIFLHGWPLSSDSWDDHAMAVADAGFRSISYDRRGFGRSTHPWNGYDYNTLADDLAAVIEQTGATDATLVGFSMGGGEVARYMSRHGGKSIEKAVLVSSIVPYMLKTDDNPKGTEQSVFDEMAAGMKEDRAAFFADFLKHFMASVCYLNLLAKKYLNGREAFQCWLI